MDVASARKALNLTQAEFAEKLGTSVGYIGHIETGVRRPSIKLAVKIEKLAGVSGLVDAVVADKMKAA